MKPKALLSGVAALVLIVAGGGIALANNTGLASLTPARVDNFRLTDNQGFAQDLKRLVDVKAIALVTSVNGDKGSQHAAKILEGLKSQHPDVAFLMLNSSAKSRDEVAAEAARLGVTMPVLHDELQLAGEQL